MAKAVQDNAPLVSVVVASFQDRKQLESCLDSLKPLHGADLEVLVSDGGSTDGTLELLQERSGEIAWWKSAQDSGIYDAWNQAIPNSRGNWLWFIGADDQVVSANIGEALSQLRSIDGDDVIFAYGRLDLVDSSGELMDTLGRPFREVSWQFRHGMPIHLPHGAMFHRRHIFEKFGPFDTKFRIAGDYEYLLRASDCSKERFCYIGGDSLIRKGVDGISFRKRHLSVAEFRKARIANSMRGITIPWLFIYARALVREMF